MSDELVLSRRHSPEIAIVTLNRPDKRNALNVALLGQLTATLDNLEKDPACRVVILGGEGNVFCAGMDLVEAASAEANKSAASGIRRVLEQLRDSRLVSIAAAHGAAYGGGGGLIAACDLVVAANDLRIAFPETRRGLVPALVSVVLAKKLRDGDLRELFLVGEPISPLRAQEIGLAQWVVPKEQLLSHTLAIAERVTLGGPDAVHLTKLLLNRRAIDFQSLHAIHEQVRQSDEAAEGMAAFREGRQPNWVPATDKKK